VSNKNRFLTIVLGAAALAGLTYGVTRRGQQRRAVQPPASQTIAVSADSAERESLVPELPASDWETLSVHGQRRASLDALDLAMNLDGIFDAPVDDELAFTARPSDRVPPPLGGDHEESPSADDLGSTWLAQATQAERSTGASGLIPEVENIALIEDTDPLDADDEHDEHEDFRRTRA